MDKLPICNIPIDKNIMKQIFKYNFDSDNTYICNCKYSDLVYKALIRNIEYYIGSDCWSVVINEEIMFNSYDETQNCNSIIMTGIIREKLYTDLDGSLLNILISKLKPFNIEIYMFGRNSYKICVEFTYRQDNEWTFKISGFGSVTFKIN